MDRSDAAYRGQADYTPMLLRAYDPLVLGPILRYVWHCPAERLVTEYREHIRDRHLDVGPGTGYFVDRSGLPDGSRVTLLDPNPSVLHHAAGRLRRFGVTAIEADVLKPLPFKRVFRTAGLSAVLHCLPGPPAQKARAIAHIAAVLEPDGKLFGATVIGREGHHGWLARRFLWAFNRRGAFDNMEDTEADLRIALEASFARVRIETVGSFAIFVAEHPLGDGESRPAAS